MKTPRSMDLVITNNCNLRCRYCYHFHSPGDVERDLPLDAWVSIIEELGRMKVMEVKLGGGEPFLRKDLPEIIDAVVKNNMRYKIFSNGALITKEMACHIASSRRCGGIQISVDGSGPETHDSFRGKGTFEKALEGIGILREYGVPVFVKMTIHKNNFADIEKTADLLIGRMNLPSLSTNSAYCMGLCSQNTESVQLSISERTASMKALLKLDKKYPGRIKGTAGPLAQARQWRKVLQAKADGVKSFPGGGYLTACNGVFKNLAIRADGAVIPCNQLSHLILGYGGKDSLEDIWREHPVLIRLRDRIKIELSRFEKCRNCQFIGCCTGSCPGIAYITGGSDEAPNMEDCLLRFIEEGGEIPREEQ